MAHKTDKRVIREAAADWALRRSEGELSPDEGRAFGAWLTARPEHPAAYERAAGILGESRTILREDADFAMRSLNSGNDGVPLSKVAAVSVVLLGLCLWFAFDMPLRMTADARTASNETTVVTLRDGTLAHLNGNSALDEDFSPGIRRVRLLRGEVYFEVSKDPTRPFVVDAGGGEVRALGTAFNVNLVGGMAEVTVTESRVSVVGEARGEGVVLHPGDRISYGRDGQLSDIIRVPAGLEAPWLTNRLVFEERPLASVMEEIFRRLPGRLVIANPATGRRLVSGTFDLGDPELALRDFGRAFGIKIVRAGPVVTIIY